MRLSLRKCEPVSEEAFLIASRRLGTADGLIAVAWFGGERLLNCLGAAAVRAELHSFLADVIVLVALTLATDATLGSEILTFKIVETSAVSSVIGFRSASQLLIPLMLWPAGGVWLHRLRPLNFDPFPNFPQ